MYLCVCICVFGHTTLTQQTLTRVSISRNSRREMIHIFLSRSREANFHVSFSSRFSRLENNFSFFFRPISLSPLDFQDFWRKFLCLLSIFKIFLINILLIDHWAWYVKICFYHFIIWPLSLSSNCPTGSWPHPDTASDKDCRKGKFLPLWFFVFSKV